MTGPVQAQVLQGRVTDAETQEPLAGATLFIPALQAGTATDADGLYRLSVKRSGTYRVVISFVGYQTLSETITVAEDPVTLDVVLLHTTLEAPAITITAKAQASDILSTPQAVSVLEGRELDMHRGTTAFDALGETAGVRLLRTGPGIAKPMVRGLTSQRVLVIQNGIRQEGQQWGDEHAPELDAFDVDRIEVVKGPASLLYGSDALGGVIQASSGDLFDRNRPLEGEVAIQGLSNTRQGAGNVQLGGATRSLFYEGSLSLRRAGNVSTPRRLIPNTALEEINGAVRLGRAFSWGRVLGEYQHFNAKLGLFEPEEALEGGDRFDIAQPFQRVSHDRTKLQLNLPVGLNRLEWVNTVQQNRRKEFEDEEEEGALQKQAALQAETPALFLRLTTVTSDARFHHRPLGRLFGTIGLSGFYQRNETLAEENLIPGARTINGAAYVFEELSLPALTLSGGLRLDTRALDVNANEDLGVEAQTRHYRAFSGALGMAWQPVTGLSVAVNGGRAWRAPVLIELFGNGVHEGTIRYERGDPTLESENNLTLESTVRWLTSHFYVEVSGYVNTIDNYIFPRRTEATDPGSGFSIYQYEQAEARLWGGEVRMDYHPHTLEWVHLHLSGDVTRTRNLDTDTPLPFSPPPRLRAELELEQKQIGPAEQVSFRIGPTFMAEQTRIDPTETPTDGYTLWNAALSGTLATGGLTITPILAVDNIFDTAYISHLSRFKPFDVLDPGRNVRFEVQVQF